MDDLETIEYATAGHVATITLVRPEQHNSVTPQTIRELVRAIARADADDGVRCVIVTGSGRVFCAGADLTGGADAFDVESGEQEFVAEREGARAVVHAIYDSPKPFVAALNGSAVGFGLTMTLPMDVRLCADHAKLGFVFTRRGMIPDAASTWFLPRLVGPARAAEWLYTARTFRAPDAERAGLVSSIHPAEEVVARANELAEEIAQASPVAVSFTKALLWRASTAPTPTDVLDLDSPALRELGAGPDAAEGVAAFLEKREPAFRGRVSTDMPSNYGWWRRS